MLSAESVQRALPAAFEILNARGANLLVALGRFGAWRGELSVMRGDADAGAVGPTGSESPDARAENGTVLLVASALEALPAHCRERLYLRYGLSAHVGAAARKSKTSLRRGRRFRGLCFAQLMASLEQGVTVARPHTHRVAAVDRAKRR